MKALLVKQAQQVKHDYFKLSSSSMKIILFTRVLPIQQPVVSSSNRILPDTIFSGRLSTQCITRTGTKM